MLRERRAVIYRRYQYFGVNTRQICELVGLLRCGMTHTTRSEVCSRGRGSQVFRLRLFSRGSEGGGKTPDRPEDLAVLKTKQKCCF